MRESLSIQGFDSLARHFSLPKITERWEKLWGFTESLLGRWGDLPENLRMPWAAAAAIALFRFGANPVQLRGILCKDPNKRLKGGRLGQLHGFIRKATSIFPV
jgi:hypothetical protein